MIVVVTPSRYQLLGQVAQPSIVPVDGTVCRKTHGAREYPRNVGVQQSRAAAQTKHVHGGRRVGSQARQFAQSLKRLRHPASVLLNNDSGHLL